jgi:hypothetical protein
MEIEQNLNFFRFCLRSFSYLNLSRTVAYPGIPFGGGKTGTKISVSLSSVGKKQTDLHGNVFFIDLKAPVPRVKPQLGWFYVNVAST